MKLNHLNLVMSDIPSAVAFFETCLGFRCLENRKDAVAVLTSADNFVLVLWASKLNRTDTVSYPENFHIGFYQPDKEAVMALYDKLKRAGVVLESEPRKMRNTFGFYFYFDNVMIEISVIPSAPD